jgi:hypothetical protein
MTAGVILGEIIFKEFDWAEEKLSELAKSENNEERGTAAFAIIFSQNKEVWNKCLQFAKSENDGERDTACKLLKHFQPQSLKNIASKFSKDKNYNLNDIAAQALICLLDNKEHSEWATQKVIEFSESTDEHEEFTANKVNKYLKQKKDNA